MSATRFRPGFGIATAVCLALFCAVAVAAEKANWVGLSANAPQAPSVKIVASTLDGIELKLDLPGIMAGTADAGGGGYGVIAIPDCGHTSTIGDPRLPVVRRLLVAPEGAQVTVSATGDVKIETLASLGMNTPLLPTQPPIPKIRGAIKAAPFKIDAAAYASDAFAPDAAAIVTEAGRFAGRRLIMVEMSPVLYNPAKGSISVRSTMRVAVKFNGGRPAVNPLSAREDAELGRMVLNHAVTSPAPKPAGRLLVIVHDSLEANLSTFVTHKTGEGWTVDVANTTTAGTTTAAIKAYIQSRYDNLSTRPDFVLLVGDTNLMPCYTGVAEDNPDTDLYYACMDAGDDWQPEFPVGRFSVQTTGQLDATVAKTMGYETSSPGVWMTKAAFMASEDNYTISEGTHDWVIATYMDPLGYASDKLYCHTNSATSSQVAAAFNDGREFGVYSGHGGDTYWADGPLFFQSDVNALTNAGMYPFVCSFACLTGHMSVDECFAETWQRAPAKGAVEVLASSVTSYWDQDDTLERELFVALLGENLRRFGDATLRAKQLYLGVWGASDPFTRRYFEMYNLFGDPTVYLTQPNLGIATASPLPTAYLGESYNAPLTAVGGTTPYKWSLAAGTLPDGLVLDGDTDAITGTPTTLGNSDFAIRVTDDTTATADKAFELSVANKLAIVSGSPLPFAVVNRPYSVTLNATGGTSPFEWSCAAIGSYAETTSSISGLIGGGTPRGWQADEASWVLDLPWAFPFYGATYTSCHVCSDGYIDFATASTDWESSDAKLIANKRIAGLWDDLRTNGYGDDIFVTQSSTSVVIWWQGRGYYTGSPVRFEIVLYKDGKIRFNYGAGLTGLAPVIGVSAGDGSHYRLSVRDGDSTIPANSACTFAFDNGLPSGVKIEATGRLRGTPTRGGHYTVKARVCDSAAAVQTATKDLALTVKRVSRLKISGLTRFRGGLTRVYTCTAVYTDGTSQRVTTLAKWAESSSHTRFTAAGRLATTRVTANYPCCIYASFAGVRTYFRITLTK